MREKIVKGLVNFFFVARYWALFFLLAILGFITNKVYHATGSTIRDAVAVFAGGAVIITIFYAFINYEYAQRKFKHDIKSSKEVLSFNIAMEWQREYMTKNLEILREFYLKHKCLLENQNCNEVQSKLDKPKYNDHYTSLLVVLNFLESVSLGVKQGIMDEEFIKGFFESVFALQYSRYNSYIEYRRSTKNAPKLWINFTDLSKKWLNCS